jgi:hypothetical protein
MLQLMGLTATLLPSALGTDAKFFSTGVGLSLKYSEGMTSSAATVSVTGSSHSMLSNSNYFPGQSALENHTHFDGYYTDTPTTQNWTAVVTELSTPSTTTELEVLSLWQYKNYLAILTFSPPFLLVMATIGNLMSVIILQHPSFRKSSTSFILSVLAVVDTINVNTGLLRLWLDTAFGIDVRTFTSFGCKFHLFMVYCFQMVNFAYDIRQLADLRVV